MGDSGIQADSSPHSTSLRVRNGTERNGQRQQQIPFGEQQENNGKSKPQQQIPFGDDNKIGNTFRF
jgi:hypothetical protein